MPIKPDKEKFQVCVIIPAKDEAENLPHFLPQVIERYRVILVDNNSVDETAKIAKKLGAQTTHCSLKGYGIAVQTGISKLCDKEQKQLPKAIVILDADQSSPWESIEKLTAPILDDQADLVIAQRTMLEPGSMPWHARLGNKVQAKCINILTGSSYQDMGPLRALSFDAYQKLCMQDQNWGWNVEMQIKAKMLNFRINEIPILYAKRKFGRSKISGNLKSSVVVSIKILFSLIYYYIQSRALIRSNEH